MKTLDEVIEAQERCETYPNCHFCYLHSGPMCEWIRDALHYLKEYREKRHAYEEILTDYVALKQYWAEQQANPALTWEQLKQMEGKPVWVEPCKEWMLITEIETEPHIWLLSLDGMDYDMSLHEWQAYRKERE